MNEVDLNLITKRIVQRISVKALEPIPKYRLLGIPEGTAKHYPWLMITHKFTLDNHLRLLHTNVNVITAMQAKIV